ncbi:MAG: MFS transporter [Sphingomonadaceae bacterium]|nr:MFS transporter [Sphingomonadaceae bacterium]
MMFLLANATYRRLLLAQVVALVGTGLLTVALGLLAYDLAGGSAGAVLGTALAIKMVVYIGIAPVVGAYADRLPRRGFLVAMDIVRAGVAAFLPFVDSVWQIYALIFVLQSASAAFTPTFQATIPDILPDERDYTRALSLSRLAYDLESLLSPMLAALLLSVMSFHWLFSGTAIGFVGSALLVMATVLPKPAEAAPRSDGIYARTTRGIRFYLATPRLRGLLAINLAAAAASAMVIVNTVVIVRDGLGRGTQDVAFALAAYGGGSMLAAFALPRLLERLSDRHVMLAAAAVLTTALATMAAITSSLPFGEPYWRLLLGGWFVLGIAYSMSITPSGRLLRRSANASDRPAIFAAQFALSHACWLIAYPLAGNIGAGPGMVSAFAAMAVLAAAGTTAALAIWPSNDPDLVEHSHDELAADHPHLLEGHADGQGHSFVIDDEHPRWPR